MSVSHQDSMYECISNNDIVKEHRTHVRSSDSVGSSTCSVTDYSMSSSGSCCMDMSKKSVRFDGENLEQRFVLEISSEERKAKWMSRADFRAINREISHAVQESFVRRSAHAFDYGDADSDSINNETDQEKCFRGLEAIISSGRRVQIQSFIQDLLEMQEELRELGLPGKELQDFSENHMSVKAARERARRMADKDACEARQVYAEMTGHKRQ